jgi:hypothetical protein
MAGFRTARLSFMQTVQSRSNRVPGNRKKWNGIFILLVMIKLNAETFQDMYIYITASFVHKPDLELLWPETKPRLRALPPGAQPCPPVPA